MAERPHHSIGEVLSLLKEDHPDVTISKIRFLESQGLIDPERTPSGYRKFYAPDIERLRWILTQQRDNFLPLKVIKRRLEDAGFELTDVSTAPDGPLPEPTLFAKREEGVADESSPTEAISAAVVLAAEQEEDDVKVPPAPESDTEPEPRTPSPPVAEGDPLSTPAGSVSLTAGELAGAAGVDLAFVGELEKLGLIASVAVDDSPPTYDHEALVVAHAAASLADRGMEPRHMRMFKVAAQREAGMFEQLTAHLVSKGGPSRARARDDLNDLARLGETIHRSVLRRALRDSLG